MITLLDIIENDGLRGELFLGAVPTTLTGFTPHAISSLKVDYSYLYVKVISNLTYNQQDKVNKRTNVTAVISKRAGAFIDEVM